MPTVDQAEFTRTMAHVPTPVTVVTTVDAAGRRWGFTASSFSSLSLDPPLVLVCPAKTASCHDAFVSAGQFLVNVLAAGQKEIAGAFARSGADKFAGTPMEPCEFGLPGLAAATARIACTLHEVLDGGDHSILVGRVESVFLGGAEPLVYHNRRFTKPRTSVTLAATS
ncbi:flavin reductase family protein [Streptomyces sp. CA-210063]|uniref:flavin reductase family protein n=1 Tax=Streptomyces sp. CA-210063 TaxID=2801029 RepID=UPI00214C19A1|nr:flavin reductase family protein [Streptomyces sp. CA-210063]UUU30192.1 flavin reductase family protein [Streptomyces sp. CA-210063]